ncbi:hypothetical protein ROZALSC1DRAFT_26345, partial [Rozella allomycis CSF55]
MAYKASKSELDSLLDLKKFKVLQLLAYYAIVVVKDQNLLGLIFGSFFLTQNWYHHRFFLAWGNGVYMNDQMRGFIVQLNAQDFMKLGKEVTFDVELLEYINRRQMENFDNDQKASQYSALYTLNTDYHVLVNKAKVALAKEDIAGLKMLLN